MNNESKMTFEQKHQAEVERYNYWYDNYGADVAKFLQNSKSEPKLSTLEEFEIAEKARKDEEKKKADKESMAKTLYSCLESNCRSELKSVFNQIELKIQKDYKTFEIEEFKDYVNLAYEIIMLIVNEQYSTEVLDRARYRALGML